MKRTIEKTVVILVVTVLVAQILSVLPAFAVIPPSPYETALYTSTHDGVARIFSDGSKQTFEHIKSGYSLEILGDKLYVNQYSGYISVYTTEGVFLRNITIPSSVPYFLTFVVLPDERIALLDNYFDKVYFIDSSGAFITSVNILDAPDGHLQNVDGVVVNNELILSEDGNMHILQIDLASYAKTIFKDLSGLPETWLGAITYSNGYYYVCGPSSIYRFSEESGATEVAEILDFNIAGIVVVNDYAYVSVNYGGKIYKVDLKSGISEVFTSGLNYPEDLEVYNLLMLPRGLTVQSIVDSASPLTEDWSYSITYPDETEGAFTLPANGGMITFDNATFIAGGIFTITATPKYGYATDISAQTDEDSSAEIEGLQAIVTLAPNGAAWVTFTNAEEAFATVPLSVPPPSGMTYSVPPFKVVPIQVAWNPDKNNDGKIDLVAGKPTAVLVNLTGASSGVTLRLAFAGAAPLPSPMDKVVTAADLAANSIVSFYPIYLDTISARDVTISVSYIEGTGTNIDPTTVTVRKTNDLSLYYGYLSKSAPTQANYNAEVTNSIAFMNMTYPVKNVAATTAYTKVTSQSSMLKDCMAIADKALANNRAVGVAVVSSTYFPNYGKPDAVGVSYGPNFKGVIVAENYWTAASHEVGHTFNLYWTIPEEYYSYPLYGQSASGVSAASGQWRAGQDFMGCAPYKTLDNTWVNSGITYNSLFNSLTQTLNDPEIVIVSGIFHKDGTFELPLTWSHLEQGTPSQIVPGHYALKFVDAGGNQIGAETSFDAQFYGSISMGVTAGKNRPTTEGGTIETDEAGFIFAAEFPEGTSEIRVMDNTNPSSPVVKGIVEASEIVDIGVPTDAYFTDADYNPIDSLECIFTPSTGSSYKMSATNPGTFCYNLKITNNNPTETFAAAVNIPSNFTLKPLSAGADPVLINSQPVAYSFSGGLLSVPNIQISEGQTITLTVRLDYKLKFQHGSPQPYSSSSQTTFAKGYAFHATVNSFSADTGTIAAVGKKVTAIGGFLTDVNGVPKGGLTVTALSGGSIVGTDTSTSDGFYFITLASAGTYTVKITNTLTTPVELVTGISVAENQFVQKDFNTLSPADPAITGFVKDNSDNPISGVTVQLLSRTGRVMATTSTNLGGYYVFRFSQPGQYTVKITVPAGYTAAVTSTTLTVKQFETDEVDFNLSIKT